MAATLCLLPGFARLSNRDQRRWADHPLSHLRGLPKTRADDVAAGLSSTALLVAVIVHLTLFGLKIPTGLGLAGLLLLIVFIGGAAGLRMCVRWMIPKARSCLDRDWPVDFLSTPLSTSHEQGKRHGPQAAPGIRAEGYSRPNARRKTVTCASESNSVRWSRSDVASGDGL